MNDKNIGVGLSSTSTVTRNKTAASKIGFLDTFQVDCFSADGELKWSESFDNAVTDEGLDYAMDVLFYGGTAYTEGSTADWYVGLIGASPTIDGTETGADLPIMTGHFAEYTDYDEANRQSLNLNAAATASGGTVTNSNSSAVASFTINTPAPQVGGCFICAGGTANTISSTATLLYGIGAFTGGNKTVDAGDTLNVTVYVTAAAA